MSVTFEIEHRIEISPAEYIRAIHLDREFNVWLHEEKLGVGYREIENDTEEGTRKIEMLPSPDLPDVLRKAIGENFKMIEDGALEGETYRFIIHPSRFADRIQVKGEMTLRPAEGGACIRHVAVTVDAKVLGIRGVIEKAIEKNVKKSLTESAEYANEWIRMKRG
ncbi:MAG: DUF2505 domain-containing protein [Sandaracinaceae bacterium]|nr:DUF2505 domain-containing protein [Sandaracinaceae bacterium]